MSSTAAVKNWLFPKPQRYMSREEAERMYLPQEAAEPAPPPSSISLTRVLLAAGGLAAIGGAVWYFYLRPKPSSSSSSSGAPQRKSKHGDGSFAAASARAKRDQAAAEAASAAPSHPSGPVRSVKPPVLSTLPPPDCLDGSARGEWVRSTDFAEDRGFGCFHCTACGHLWRSVNAWTKEVRQCPKCAAGPYFPPYAMWRTKA